MAGLQGGGIPDKETIFNMAEMDMEYRVGNFNGMIRSCFDKCVQFKLSDPDLNLGENSCIDRCVAKYFQVTGIVGKLVQAPIQ